MSINFAVVGVMDKWKPGDLRCYQEVNVVLKSYTSLEDGSICITPRMVSDEEIDYEIDALIKDLEKVRIGAKKNLKTVNEKIRKGL